LQNTQCPPVLVTITANRSFRSSAGTSISGYGDGIVCGESFDGSGNHCPCAVLADGSFLSELFLRDAEELGLEFVGIGDDTALEVGAGTWECSDGSGDEASRATFGCAHGLACTPEVFADFARDDFYLYAHNEDILGFMD
jgi:hypothetical protein